MRIPLARLQVYLSVLWAGMTLTIGALAAPALFATLDKAAAGLAAGRLFDLEAKLSLLLAMVLFLLERQRVREVAQVRLQSMVTPTLLMILGALFLTILGQFGLHPMIQASKAGQATVLSFAALHGVSASLYWIKAVLLVVLSWRLTTAR